jgi:hypothetical protein
MPLETKARRALQFAGIEHRKTVRLIGAALVDRPNMHVPGAEHVRAAGRVKSHRGFYGPHRRASQ